MCGLSTAFVFAVMTRKIYSAWTITRKG